MKEYTVQRKDDRIPGVCDISYLNIGLTVHYKLTSATTIKGKCLIVQVRDDSEDLFDFFDERGYKLIGE